MGQQMTSRTVTFCVEQFDTETVTINRVAPGTTPGTFTTTQIYSGPADMQIGSGGSYQSPSGAVEQGDANLTIDPATPGGALPACMVGDRVEYGGATYTIVQWAAWAFPIKLASAMLKRGVLTNRALK